MRLKTVLVRFYKSFNFNYLRKYNDKAEPKPWEYVGEQWYPYVTIPIDSKVTNVVGANESGKSQLLSAIEKGISGQNIERGDFCRYSQFFTSEQGKLKYPDFGFMWTELTNEDLINTKSSCKISDEISFDHFYLFRENKNKVIIYILEDKEYVPYQIVKEKLGSFTEFLPRVFRMNSDIALPESIPIRKLADTSGTTKLNIFETLERRKKSNIVDQLYGFRSSFASQQNIVQAAPQFFSTFAPYFSSSVVEDEKKEQEYQLARSLIIDVAKIAPESLIELYNSIQDGKEGLAKAIIQKINERLESCLNFPQWWVQDKDFKLNVSARDSDLSLTIRDRTGTDYSFDERSSGLKYFLSYYVQYLSHKPLSDNPEILLMDEPDAYLSSQAQQDLLKIFEAFANPNDGKLPIQVVYVTHSPFLINKNYAERIRVLEKGSLDEGTRVVKNVSRNHYEPLRSAFGAYVGETTFIGNCNLFVEGLTDQIFIAGAANYLQSLDISNLDRLDLNSITIVPAGSAGHIPYLVYVACGRDVDKPAIIVLLDSDKSGDEAKKGLQRGGIRNKQILKDDFIFQIGELKSLDDANTLREKLLEIEDLIPINICIEAIKLYLKDICEADESIIKKISPSSFSKHFDNDKDFFDAVDGYVSEISLDKHHVNKIGFAKNVIQIVNKPTEEQLSKAKNKLEFNEFANNFMLLFRQINRMQRQAKRDIAKKGITQRIKRAKKSFLRDYPQTAKKENALMFFDDIESILDDSLEGDWTKAKISELRRKYELDTDLTQSIKDFDKFREDLHSIAYEALKQSQDI